MVMTPGERAFVTLLNKVQWVLTEACHDIPAGRYGTQHWHDLADMLENISLMAREQSKPPIVIDPSLAGDLPPNCPSPALRPARSGSSG
jgi:hypothetical protein